jgi:hypothetical protein
MRTFTRRQFAAYVANKRNERGLLLVTVVGNGVDGGDGGERPVGGDDDGGERPDGDVGGDGDGGGGEDDELDGDGDGDVGGIDDSGGASGGNGGGAIGSRRSTRAKALVNYHEGASPRRVVSTNGGGDGDGGGASGGGGTIGSTTSRRRRTRTIGSTTSRRRRTRMPAPPAKRHANTRSLTLLAQKCPVTDLRRLGQPATVPSMLKWFATPANSNATPANSGAVHEPLYKQAMQKVFSDSTGKDFLKLMNGDGHILLPNFLEPEEFKFLFDDTKLLLEREFEKHALPIMNRLCKVPGSQNVYPSSGDQKRWQLELSNSPKALEVEEALNKLIGIRISALFPPLSDGYKLFSVLVSK